jgi:Na+/H+ antiporter NhaD/arsenite permease-like protein
MIDGTISIIILLAVFVLIAVRQIGNLKLKIWQIALGGAVAMLLTFQLSPIQAFSYLNFDVIFFLIGVFIIGESLYRSGYLAHFSYKLFGKTKSSNALIAILIVFVGIVAALLVNDAIAIIGTPVMLLLANRYKINAKLMLLALMFSMTIGSVFTPIGNPQNLLIALSGGVRNPFVTFFSYLFIPTMINLFVLYLLLRLFYPKEFKKRLQKSPPDVITDKKLATLSKASMILMIVLIAADILIITLNINFDFRLTYIALIAALPVVLFSNRRFEIIKGIDWSTIVLFISLFIVMGGVWQAGIIQSFVISQNLDIYSTPIILVVSIVASQFISNVPLVLLYLKLLTISSTSVVALMALAAGSTIAGNLFILGAASNVIVIQRAERKGGASVSFLDFAKIGIPLTIINVIVYYLFLAL